MTKILTNGSVNIFTSGQPKTFTNDLSNMLTSDVVNMFTSKLAKILTTNLTNMFTIDLGKMFTSDVANIFTRNFANMFISDLDKVSTSDLVSIFTGKWLTNLWLQLMQFIPGVSWGRFTRTQTPWLCKLLMRQSSLYFRLFLLFLWFYFMLLLIFFCICSVLPVSICYTCLLLLPFLSHFFLLALNRYTIYSNSFSVLLCNLYCLLYFNAFSHFKTCSFVS